MPLKQLFLLFSYIILITSPVISTEEPDKSSWSIFTGTTIIDGTDAPPLEDGVIVVRDDKILSVLPSAKFDRTQFPKTAQFIAVNGKFIMSILVATHAHLGLLKGTVVASSHVTKKNVLRQLNKYARRGFGVEDVAPPATAGLDRVYRARSVAEIINGVREVAPHNPDCIKLWIDDGGAPLYPKRRPEIYKAAIEEAHHLNLKVAAHVYYLSDAKQLVKDGGDFLAHSIRDLPVDQELIDLIKETKTALNTESIDSVWLDGKKVT